MYHTKKEKDIIRNHYKERDEHERKYHENRLSELRRRQSEPSSSVSIERNNNSQRVIVHNPSPTLQRYWFEIVNKMSIEKLDCYIQKILKGLIDYRDLYRISAPREIDYWPREKKVRVLTNYICKYGTTILNTKDSNSYGYYAPEEPEMFSLECISCLNRTKRTFFNKRTQTSPLSQNVSHNSLYPHDNRVNRDPTKLSTRFENADNNRRKAHVNFSCGINLSENLSKHYNDENLKQVSSNDYTDQISKNIKHEPVEESQSEGISQSSTSNNKSMETFLRYQQSIYEFDVKLMQTNLRMLKLKKKLNDKNYLNKRRFEKEYEECKLKKENTINMIEQLRQSAGELCQSLIVDDSSQINQSDSINDCGFILLSEHALDINDNENNSFKRSSLSYRTYRKDEVIMAMKYLVEVNDETIKELMYASTDYLFQLRKANIDNIYETNKSTPDALNEAYWSRDMPSEVLKENDTERCVEIFKDFKGNRNSLCNKDNLKRFLPREFIYLIILKWSCYIYDHETTDVIKEKYHQKIETDYAMRYTMEKRFLEPVTKEQFEVVIHDRLCYLLLLTTNHEGNPRRTGADYKNTIHKWCLKRNEKIRTWHLLVNDLFKEDCLWGSKLQ